MEITFIKENEFGFIKDAIESRLNKKIKGIKKIYQASIDGGEPYFFHLKCDHIPNTLVIIKSEGNRRFGGFTSLTWDSPKKYKYKDDKNAFLFSLDKLKIYSYDNNQRAIYCFYKSGPSFGFGHDIGIDGNIINLYLNKSLFFSTINLKKRNYIPIQVIKMIIVLIIITILILYQRKSQHKNLGH